MALDPAANARKYAWCTDLFGGPGDTVLSDGVNWRPVRPFSTQIVANGDSNMNLTWMSNAPTVIVRGVLTLSRTVTMQTTYAYKGAKFRVKREATGTLLSLLVNGIGLGLNSWADFEYDPAAGWVQTASGGLL